MIDELFGEVISSYSRAQAIDEGVLVDVSQSSEAKECGFKFPIDPRKEHRRRVLEFRRQFQSALQEAGAVDLREQWCLSQVEFKKLVLMQDHIEPEAGICHQCGHPLSDAAVTVCRTCRTLNLNWERD